MKTEGEGAAEHRSNARVVAGYLTLLGGGLQLLGVLVNISYIHHEWLAMRLAPENAMLFVPGLSAIPTHLRALLDGRTIDVWALWVVNRYGAGVFAATVALPLGILTGAVLLLLQGLRTAADTEPRDASG